MSASDELQELIYNRLISDAGVSAIVGDKVFDRAKPRAAAPYISFGPSDGVPDDAECITGRVETMQIDCWSDSQGGKSQAKRLVDAVKSSLHEWAGTLAVNALVEMRVVLWRVFDDPDGVISHGVVTVEAMIEEN